MFAKLSIVKVCNHTELLSASEYNQPLNQIIERFCFDFCNKIKGYQCSPGNIYNMLYVMCDMFYVIGFISVYTYTHIYSQKI